MEVQCVLLFGGDGSTYRVTVCQDDSRVDGWSDGVYCTRAVSYSNGLMKKLQPKETPTMTATQKHYRIILGLSVCLVLCSVLGARYGTPSARSLPEWKVGQLPLLYSNGIGLKDGKANVANESRWGVNESESCSTEVDRATNSSRPCGVGKLVVEWTSLVRLLQQDEQKRRGQEGRRAPKSSCRHPRQGYGLIAKGCFSSF